MENINYMCKDDLIRNPKECKPHVVLLGAGASVAAFPNGDANGKILPVMNSLVEIVALKSLLEEHKITSTENFELIYSKLQNDQLKNKIEMKIFDYFSSLALPKTVTHYDRLLLSLRKKDAIFTFNWDPFLWDSWVRNNGIASLPQIYFLHGNVRIGSCDKHPQKYGYRSYRCDICKTKFSVVPLLFPIEKKKYFESNEYIKHGWQEAKNRFAQAFTLSIFGYSAPTSDLEAVELLNKAWLDNSSRKFEHIEIIDILNSDQLNERWENFSPTNHFLNFKAFEGSGLWNWPRRTCEALYYPMIEGMPCEQFPLPETNDLEQLHQYIKEIARYEK